jgi:hypothetical protein
LVVVVVVGAAVVVVAFVVVRLLLGVVVEAADEGVAVVVEATAAVDVPVGTRPTVRTADPAMAPATPSAVTVRTRCRALSLAEVELREKPAAEGFSLFVMVTASPRWLCFCCASVEPKL